MVSYSLINAKWLPPSKTFCVLSVQAPNRTARYYLLLRSTRTLPFLRRTCVGAFRLSSLHRKVAQKTFIKKLQREGFKLQTEAVE